MMGHAGVAPQVYEADSLTTLPSPHCKLTDTYILVMMACMVVMEKNILVRFANCSNLFVQFAPLLSLSRELPLLSMLCLTACAV